MTIIKTTMHPGFAKLLGVIFLVIFLTMILLAFAQIAQNLIANVGWHDMASVGWVG